MSSDRVGITASCFDLFHAGHVLMLQEAKEQCDRLVVALQTDPTIDRPEKNKPVQSIFERWVQVEGCMQGASSCGELCARLELCAVTW